MTHDAALECGTERERLEQPSIAGVLTPGQEKGAPHHGIDGVRRGDADCPPRLDTEARRPFAELFGLDPKHGRRSRDGGSIMVTVLGLPSATLRSFVPDVDPRYVYPPELTKNVVMALEGDMNIYLTGHTGTGKTTMIEQCCALTNRPRVRVQHTQGMEESHIVGQWTVKRRKMEYMFGPLPFAMMHGLVYLADEYDMASPSITATYQAVMEHQSLYIRDAPEESRVIRPHPSFRFCGTGNTGGGGDETGLYQGTQIQNAANFSRWEVTEIVGYNEPSIEARIVMQQAGVSLTSAERLVDVATRIRKEFVAGRVSNTIGPRELVNAAKVGKIKGGDYRAGLKLAFSNRLSNVDRATVDGMAQRIFG